MKTLVTWFSAEGNTARVAKSLADTIGADQFEIIPQQPYTSADIKWTNPLARCNKEKLGKKDVPVKGSIEGFEDYDLIFIGFPIWYYGAPNVIYTFCKGYDWSGKKIALFATSGGSDIGKTAEKLQPYIKGGSIVGAKVVRSASELEAWAKSII